MSVMVAVAGHRRSRRFRMGAAAGAAVPMLVLLVFSLVPRGGSPSLKEVPADLTAQREALEIFEQALRPLVDDGATTVVYGMRPGIADIAQGRFADETLVTMARGWVRSTEGVRDRFRQIVAPAFLGEASERYGQSFDEYLSTARALLAAAEATGEQRAAHLQAAARHGTLADHAFDAAEAALRTHRDRLGP